MKRLRGPILFALALAPLAAVAGYFVAKYQLEMYDPALLEEAIAQLGSADLLPMLTAVQSVGYGLFCGFFGRLLAERTGLWRPFRLEKKPLLQTAGVSVISGILFSLDWWTFGALIPGIRETTAAGLTVSGWIASVLYGGIMEEVMLRLFMLSLTAWLLWRVFRRKEAGISQGVVAAANVIAALLFAAGHLPATVVLFGELDPLLVARCFLFNGGFGLLFGWLYRRYGIQYSMLSHGLTHIVCKLILIIFT